VLTSRTRQPTRRTWQSQEPGPNKHAAARPPAARRALSPRRRRELPALGRRVVILPLPLPLVLAPAAAVATVAAAAAAAQPNAGRCWVVVLERLVSAVVRVAVLVSVLRVAVSAVESGGAGAVCRWGDGFEAGGDEKGGAG
jgi:uncharacterized membrane protein YgcG